MCRMAGTAEEKLDLGMAANDIDDDEHDSKERVLQKYFLLEWKLVKSLLDDIVSNGRVSDPSTVHTIRSIVVPSLSHSIYICNYVSICHYICVYGHNYTLLAVEIVVHELPWVFELKFCYSIHLNCFWIR